MGLIDRLFGKRPGDEVAALYAAIVAKGREPYWFLDGEVADTVDGRFDSIAAVLSLVLLRLEEEAEGVAPSTHLAERFVDDMDAQLREIGIGDIVVGKHIGRMMSMLGGRLGAYRAGLAERDLAPALVRNLYRGAPPAPEALAHVEGRLQAFHDALAATPIAALLEGRLP